MVHYDWSHFILIFFILFLFYFFLFCQVLSCFCNFYLFFWFQLKLLVIHRFSFRFSVNPTKFMRLSINRHDSETMLNSFLVWTFVNFATWPIVNSFSMINTIGKMSLINISTRINYPTFTMHFSMMNFPFVNIIRFFVLQFSFTWKLIIFESTCIFDFIIFILSIDSLSIFKNSIKPIISFKRMQDTFSMKETVFKISHITCFIFVNEDRKIVKFIDGG